MAKDAYYFSHDANARQDPKILEMISVYGIEGYGRYWILVEMLREQSDYTLSLTGKYTFNALAMQMQCTADASKEFVHDCINEFGLFETNGEVFWSNSLLRRMAKKEETSLKRRKAANARWGKKPDTSTFSEDDDANAMQVHSKSNVNGMQGKERKVKEIKDNTSRTRKQVFEPDSDYYKLAEFMLSEIRKNNPSHKQPNLQTWSEDFRKLVEIDKREKREISRMIRWTQKDEFEMVNVLSPAKLRKRYDNLAMKMKRDEGELVAAGTAPAYKPYVHDLTQGED